VATVGREQEPFRRADGTLAEVVKNVGRRPPEKRPG
jgi:hypothetical protein